MQSLQATKPQLKIVTSQNKLTATSTQITTIIAH